MAYDDSRFRGQPGFREEPDFRMGVPEDAPPVGGGMSSSVYTPDPYSVGDYGPGGSESTVSLGGRRSPSAAELDDVFDDPEHGDPGRDRMAVHAMWELVLLAGVVTMAYLLRDASSTAVRGAQLNDLLVFGAAIGLVTVGMGLSLRAAAPNLALGPLAYGSALFFTENSGRGLMVTAGVTLSIAVGVGLAIAILVIGLHVPAWAASLGAAFGLMIWIQRADDSATLVNGAYDPTKHGLFWFTGFAALAVVGSLFGLVKPIRRAVGRFRPVRDPARRRGGVAASLVVVSLVASSAFAAVAGVLLALHFRQVSPAEDGIALTGLALGAALLGGTSAFGRRGGIFGSILAVTLVVLMLRYAEVERLKLSPLAVAGATIIAGLVVTRLVETFGRPRAAEDEDEEEAEDWASNGGGSSNDSAWAGSRTGGWTSQLPARATDDGWGGEQGWGGTR